MKIEYAYFAGIHHGSNGVQTGSVYTSLKLSVLHKFAGYNVLFKLLFGYKVVVYAICLVVSFGSTCIY